MKFKYKALIFQLLIIMMVSSCKQNDIDVDHINTEANRKLSLSAPLINASITLDSLLKEFLNEGELMKDEDDMLYRAFHTDVELNWMSLVTLNDVNVSENISFIAQVNAPTELLRQKIKMNPNGSRYDKITFFQGSSNLNINALGNTNCSLELTIPQLKKNGQVFRIPISLVGTNGMSNTMSLNGYEAVFAQGQDSSYIELVVTRMSPASSSYGNFNLNFSLTDLQYDVAYGYFGQNTLQQEGVKLSFNIFNAYEFENKIEFYDFQVDVSAQNPIGVPFRISADSVWLSKGNNGDDAWKLQIDNNILNLSSARMSDNLLMPSSNYFYFNRNNSNIAEIGKKFPDKLVCNITSTSNPALTDDVNFVTRDNTIKSQISIRFPFWFKTALYDRTDEFEFDFLDLTSDIDEEIEEMEFFNMYFDFLNRFPFEVGLKLDVVDENGRVITTLLEPNTLISAAKPVGDGKSNEAVKSAISVKITNAQIKAMRKEKAKRLILYTNAITSNQGTEFVKLFGSSRMDVKIAADIKFRVPKSAL
jgi:hypothetical protein